MEKKVSLTWIGCGYGEELLYFLDYLKNYEPKIIPRISNIYTNEIDKAPMEEFQKKYKRWKRESQGVEINIVFKIEDATTMECPTDANNYNISFTALKPGALTSIQILNKIYKNSDSFIFFQEDYGDFYKQVMKDEYTTLEPDVVLHCKLFGSGGSKSFRNLQNLRVFIINYYHIIFINKFYILYY